MAASTSKAMSNRRVAAALEHLPRRDAADRADRAASSRASGSASTQDLHRLARRDVGAILLRQLGGDLDARGVDQIGDQLPGTGCIAGPESGIDAPGSTMPPKAIDVGAHRDEAVERRRDAQVVDVALARPRRRPAPCCASRAARGRRRRRSSRWLLHVLFELRPAGCALRRAGAGSAAPRSRRPARWRCASSSARRTANRAVSSATSSSAACTAASASALTISCSASCRSKLACSSANS